MDVSQILTVEKFNILADAKFDSFTEIITDKIVSNLERNKRYSVDQVAQDHNVSQLTVRNWIKKGLLKADQIGNRYFIKKKYLDEAFKEVKSLKYKRIA